jgi:hypothetical protein
MPLMVAFEVLPESRNGQVQRYDLRGMILMALCAVLSGGNTRVQIAN